jgi:hypothetical protein
MLSLAALAAGACGGNSVDVSTSAADASMQSRSGEGVLVLEAYGGPSGQVAADVPIIEPGVGQQRTCGAPLEAGACQFTSCQLGGIGSPARGSGNFGPIAASVGATTVPLIYSGFYYGTVYFPSSIALGTGGIMIFRGGDGAGVPTFSVSATIPGLAVITSPAPTTAGGAAIIDTSRDLSITWLPISIGQVHFQLDGGASLPGGVAVSIACTFEGASGSGVVSRTLLSSMKAMSGAGETYARVSSELDATTVVNGFTIVTRGYQLPPPADQAFDVTLQ